MVALMSACCCEKVEFRDVLIDINKEFAVLCFYSVYYDSGYSSDFLNTVFDTFLFGIFGSVSKNSRIYSFLSNPPKLSLIDSSSVRDFFAKKEYRFSFDDSLLPGYYCYSLYFLDNNFSFVYNAFCEKFVNVFSAFLSDLLSLRDSDPDFYDSRIKKFQDKYSYLIRFNYSVRVRVHYKDINLGQIYRFVDFEVLEIVRPCVMDLIKK